MSNDFCHCWLCKQGPGFARAWVPAFRYECWLEKPAVMIPCTAVLLKGFKRVGIHRRVSGNQGNIPAYENALMDCDAILVFFHEGQGILNLTISGGFPRMQSAE